MCVDVAQRFPRYIECWPLDSNGKRFLCSWVFLYCSQRNLVLYVVLFLQWYLFRHSLFRCVYVYGLYCEWHSCRVLPPFLNANPWKQFYSVSVFKQNQQTYSLDVVTTWFGWYTSEWKYIFANSSVLIEYSGLYICY